MQLQDKSIKFIETLYEILNPLSSPTPIYHIIHDPNYVQVSSLNGKAKVIKSGATEINAFDILVASLFLNDINILFEGITGVGKSFITESFFRGLFGDSGFVIDRSNFNPFVESSILSTFIKTKLVDKIPQQYIDFDKAQNIGAFFVEEVNRREVNDLLTLLDKVIMLDGKRVNLGLPYKNTKGIESLKKIIIIGSQNPDDTEHGTFENDIAEDNRFLKIPFPNAVFEAGTSQLLINKAVNLHETFWNRYKEVIEDKSSNWKDLYIQSTELPENSFKLANDQREFLDFMISYISTNPSSEVQRNMELIKDCGLELTFNLREDEFLAKVTDLQSSLRYKIVRRDINKITNFIRLVSLIRSIKRKDFTPELTIEDVASSIGVLLEGRTVNLRDNVMFDFVNDSLKSYLELKQRFNAESSEGIREMVLSKALKNYSSNSFNIDIFYSTITNLVTKFSENTFVKPALVVFNSRIIADLLLFKQFCEDNAESILETLHSSNQRDGLSKYFKNQFAYMPSIYANRLGWLVHDFEL
jgi:hypothetical protein